MLNILVRVVAAIWTGLQLAFYTVLMIGYRLSQLGVFLFECLVFFFERRIFGSGFTQLSVPKLDFRAQRVYRRHNAQGGFDPIDH